VNKNPLHDRDPFAFTVSWLKDPEYWPKLFKSLYHENYTKICPRKAKANRCLILAYHGDYAFVFVKFRDDNPEDSDSDEDSYVLSIDSTDGITMSEEAEEYVARKKRANRA